MNEKVTRACWI